MFMLSQERERGQEQINRKAQPNPALVILNQKKKLAGHGSMTSQIISGWFLQSRVGIFFFFSLSNLQWIKGFTESNTNLTF